MNDVTLDDILDISKNDTKNDSLSE